MGRDFILAEAASSRLESPKAAHAKR